MKKIFGAVTLLSIFLLENQVSLADVLPDTTLSTNTLVKEIDNTYSILEGTKSGGNLFHSFLSFDLDSRQNAHFLHDSSIINIFARVSGAKSSYINGLISSNGQANLFIMNPRGIVFGPNARLNLGGSFHATTAESILFEDNISFKSIPSKGASPLLSVRRPNGLIFGDNSGKIINQSIEGLNVEKGNTISLIGGHVKLDGGHLTAPSGRIEIGAVEANNGLKFDYLFDDHDFFSLNYQNTDSFQDIDISRLAIVDVSGMHAGHINIQGRNVTLREGGRLQSINFGIEDAGEIIVNASKSLELFGNTNLDSPLDSRFFRSGFVIPQKTTIFSTTFGLGESSSIKINARDLTLTDGADITAATDGFGMGGDLFVRASDYIYIIGETPIIALEPDRIPFNNPFTRQFLIDASTTSQIIARTPLTLDGGAGGNVRIITSNLTLQNGGNIAAGSDRGQGASLRIKASNDIEIFGSTKRGLATSFVSAASNADNNASVLVIDAKNLTIRDGGIVTVTTFASGQGGDISIHVSDSVELNGVSRNSQIVSQINSGTFSTGKAGTLKINADKLYVKNDAEVSASTFGAGVGGNISVLTDKVNIESGGKILTRTTGTGDAGDISFKSSNLFSLTGQNSGLFADTQGTGHGGNISVSTNEFLISENAVIDARTITDGVGGDIFIDTQSFLASDSGRLTTTTEGSQAAGNINLKARENLILDGLGSGLYANALSTASGPSGSITIDPSNFVFLLNEAGIGVDHQGIGIGGNIEINTAKLFLNDNAFISAETAKGQGGNIRMNISDLLLLQGSSEITSTAGKKQGTGDGGNIIISAPYIISFLQNDNDITANAFSGSGGMITLNAEGVIGFRIDNQLTPFSDISASSELGVTGTVNLNTPETNPTQNLSKLPDDFLALPALETQACNIRQNSSYENRSRFYITRKQHKVLPENIEFLQNPTITSNWMKTGEESDSIKSKSTQSPSFLGFDRESLMQAQAFEAEGWIQQPNGKVALLSLSKRNIEDSLHKFC